MKDIRNIIVHVTESKGSMTNQLDFVIHFLKSTVGNPQLSPSHDPLAMFSDHFSELFHGFQATMTGPPEPVFKMLSCPSLGDIVPEPLELLLEQVAAYHPEVELTEK